MWKNWRQLIRFIKKHRECGISKFEILTTSSEVIIIANNNNRDKLRLKY